MELDALARPWLDAIRTQIPDLALFDAHTHLGEHDPDGMHQSPDELIARLHAADALGCFVFPMHEPGGYPPANDMVLNAAREAHAQGTNLVAFCRVKPGEHAVQEAERSLANGAHGIKLHPRAEQFTLDHPDVRRLFALAHERRIPILIHAGRGIPALGEYVLRYAAEYPDARVILAHAGVCDLGWIWRAVVDTPNVLFDSAWWVPSDLLALFTLVPPAQIVFASDAPYGIPLASAACQLRLALQAGLSADQVRLIASGQALRLAAQEPLAVAGPAVGERERASHLLLDRVAQLLQIGAMMWLRSGQGADMISLARLGCRTPAEIDDAPVFAAINSLLDAYDRTVATAPKDRSSHALLMLAATLARSPDVPLPSGLL